jgi:hypothetical protein
LSVSKTLPDRKENNMFETLPPDCIGQSKIDIEPYLREQRIINGIIKILAESGINEKGIDLLKLECERQLILSADYTNR